MTTLTAPAPKSKASRTTRPFACSLTVEINGQSYGVEPIDPGECGTKAFRLAKRWADGAVYDVIRDNDGCVACDCPSYEVSHRGNGFGMCKHGRALVALGLLDAPAIVEAKAPESKTSNEVFDRRPAPVAPSMAPGVPAVAPEAPARPFGHNIPTDGPSDRDRAAAKAFGVRLPARAATPAPATPREIGVRIVAMLACPDCQGEGCPSCDDAPVACCSPAEPAPCSACVDQAPAEPNADNINIVASPTFACGCPAPVSAMPWSVRELADGCPRCRSELAELIDGPPEAPGGPRDDARGDDGRMGLAEWLDAQSELYALLDCGAGDLLSRHIQTLAQTVRAVMTPGVAWITPIEAESRMEALAGA